MMKTFKHILILSLFLLWTGQDVMGFVQDFPDASTAEIQPAHQPGDADAYPSPAAVFLNGSAQPEILFNQSLQIQYQFSESNSNEDEIRAKHQEKQFKRELRQKVSFGEIIERSLTFRELIFPHHFYF